MKSLFLVIVLCMGSELFASEENQNWKGMVRPFLLRVLSTETVDSWLGTEPSKLDEIVLPAIPKIVKKSSSTDTYDKKGAIELQGKKFQNLTADKKQQLEFNFVQELALVVRGQAADDDEVSKWLNVLDQGGSREGVYRAMVLDQDYVTLENYEKTPSEKLLAFAVSFAEKYLGKSYKKESLQKNNVFTIKRILGETGLEILDELSPKSEDVYAWYAVFSAEQATKYPEWMKGKLRSQNTAIVHYNWAKDAPFQHIKSEFLVKLHTVMNELDK